MEYIIYVLIMLGTLTVVLSNFLKYRDDQVESLSKQIQKIKHDVTETLRKNR